MLSNRDDFTKKTIDRMAKRVGYRCSNPHCRKLTCGAAEATDAYVNIGVAAHICAAAPGGKRYDPCMTEKERKSIRNGIWLCQSCAKLVDSDELRYTEEVLHKWKHDAETECVIELQGSTMDGCDLNDAYSSVKDVCDLQESMCFLELLNQEIDTLLYRMEEIQEKLDVAREDDDVYWVHNYEVRLESLAALYSNLNYQLRYLSEKARWVKHCVRELNTFGDAPVFSSFHNQSYLQKCSEVIMDQSVIAAIHELIRKVTVIRGKMIQLLLEVKDLNMQRIEYERHMVELSQTLAEKI